MRSVSNILSAFLLLVLTVVGAGLVYVMVVEPLSSSIRGGHVILRYVTNYNSTHVICFVVEGSVKGLVYRNGTWVRGLAGQGDLVIVPRELFEVSRS